MRRNSQNSDNRFYAYLSPSYSTSSRSSNRNAHYQYYDPRLRAQQQAQQALYEYQHSNISPTRNPPSLYGPAQSQLPALLHELSPSATDSVSDLGEPISVFDDIKPLEHRRSIVIPPLPLSYVSPDPSRRPSISDVRLATAQIVREQLLTDIERSITDIDRDLTTLERRSSMQRYVPSRFPPIIESDAQDDNLIRRLTPTIKPVSVQARKPIPIITSPVHKQTQQTSAHSIKKERNISSSQIWPNKPKRIYEVIPSLMNDSRKTSRQSSFQAPHEPIKIIELQSPQSSTTTIGKHASVSSIQFRGQYHYGPEIEEVEILPNDPENIDHKSTYDEMGEAGLYETLTTDQFLRDLSATPQNRALIFVPEYGGNSQMGYHDSTEDLIQNNQLDTSVARSLSAGSLRDLTSMKELNIQDTESLIQAAPKNRIEPELTARIPSRSTVTPPHELFHATETDLRNENNPIISHDIKHSRPSTVTPIATNDLQEKSPLPQIAPIGSAATLPSLSHSPPPPPVDNNVSGLVAYFFSDFGHEGEGEEDIMSIDQNNFVVTTSAEIIADDDISGGLMGRKSQPSLLILHSAHVPRQPQQQQQHQQQHTSIMPSTTENNNKYVKSEEKEEIGSIETDATKKRISTATSVLPSSSPTPKQVLPTSIIDDTQTQFNKNNNTSNDDHRRQPSATSLNMNKVYSTTEEQEKRSNNSQIRFRSPSLTPKIHSRNQLIASERNNEQIEKNNEETRSISSANHMLLRNIDNERIQTPERIDLADQRTKSSSRAPSRSLSMASNHTKKDEEITHVDSLTKTSSKNTNRTNSTSQRSVSRQSSATPSEQTLSSEQRSASLRRPLTNTEIGQSLNIPLRGESNISLDDIHKTPTNENEPNTFSVESEHFLLNKTQTSPFDFNQRSLSSYSMSHPDDSRRSSTTNSELPIALDSPDNVNNQPSTSGTTTPQRKISISSIDPPPDPSTLFTTIDEPNPHDLSLINSTQYFQMPSSQQPNNDISIPEHDEPSPSVNIVPIEEFPTRTQSVELPSELLPTEEHLRESSPILHHSPAGEIELEPNSELPPPPASPEIDIPLPPASPSNHEQEEPLHRTPSLSKNGHQQESLRQSPLLSYPARLEDLMRPTPSPFLSAHEHKENQKQQQNEEEEQRHNDRLSPVSPPINQTTKQDHHCHPIHQNIPSKSEYKDIHSPSSSPRRSVLSDNNHTSVEGDDFYRQELDIKSISPESERIISPDHHDHLDDNYNNNNNINKTKNNNHYQIQKQTLTPPPVEPAFITQKQGYPSSEKSISPPQRSHHESLHEKNLYRNDVQLSSASIKFSKHRLSPPSSPPRRSTSDEEELPHLTASQLHSKLSLRLKTKEPKRKKSINNQPPSSPSPLPQIDTEDITPMNNEDNLAEEKAKRKRQRRRVSFSDNVAHFQMEERQLFTNWRERVAAILAKKHDPNDKYAYVKPRVNSFANFEYQPKKIKIIPSKKKSHPKTNENFEESKFLKRKKFKVKKPKIRQETEIEENTNNEQQNRIQLVKVSAPQLFGRLWCLPDGSPTVFHESLEWNASSKLKAYSYENINYEPHRNDFKIYNKKPKWHSESKLTELIKDPPRFFHRQTLIPNHSLPRIPNRDEPYFYQHESEQKPYLYQQLPQQKPYLYQHQSQQEPYLYRQLLQQESDFDQQQSQQELETEIKIFDIQTNSQQQSETKLQNDNVSHRSYDTRASDIPIFNEKLVWTRQSILKDITWQNINYRPKKSNVQIFHKTVHWNSEPKIRTRSPSTQASRTSMSNVQIFDQKLNWDAQAKVHCWSEIDLSQLTKKKSIFAQYHDPKWNDVVTARVDSRNYHYPKISNHVEIFSDRLMWTRRSELKDYVWENFDYKTQRRTRRLNNQQHLQDTDQSPANRPKWNSVSKTRSVNSVYNPKVANSNMIRRGWDRELRRKRVHKLPPLKRKREREKIPQLAIDAPPTDGQLAIDYTYDHTSTIQGRTTSNGYGTSSRQSSKALVPINHSRFFSELELPNETPRSQRPVQQEWYDEMNKSRLTHRTDMGQVTNRSYRNSFDSNNQANTPRELATFRSSTRNSQNSVMSGTLLDSSIRTNRATEFRLSKDMDEHHQHTHTPSQSMPIEIRGFRLEGTQLTVNDHATIRPLSNVSYGASERVKSRRVNPWSSLHPHGTSSRNSSLVPIAEFRRPSLDTTITESQPLIHEEE